MQSFAMVSIVFTAVGCQYFVFSSQTDVDKAAGVEAVDILLLLLNVLFVAVMVGKIAKAGRADVQKVVMWLKDKALVAQRCRVLKHESFSPAMTRRWQGSKSVTSQDVAVTMSHQQSIGLAALLPERTEP